MAGDAEQELEIGHVLFLDIVGYSKLLMEEQKEQLGQLTEVVLATSKVRVATTNDRLIRLPTGDGMALVFRTSAEEPAQCALEIAKALQDHPQVKVRMGIHSGPVSEVTDLNSRTNIAGSGINLAQRVMDCGDAGHILVSKRVADDLEQYARWKPHLHDLGECRVKHGVRLRVINLYTNEAGNRAKPRKFRVARQRRNAVTAGTILLAGILVTAALILSRKSGVVSTEKSIAVLPFENLSEDKGNAYFAAGIQDEILTRLAKLRELKVIARTSTEKYPSHPPDLKTVAAELGVAHILEGSVQKIGNEVHVNVQLIKASTAAHVWAQSYDRALEHAFAVQGEVAQTVANALKVELLPEQIDKLNALPTQNPAAYDSYLRGEYALDQARKNPGDYQKVFEPAIANFQEAVAADPQFALAYARLAQAELTKEDYGHSDGGTVHNPELLAGAKQNADRALQLQPGLAEAHLALGRWYNAARHDSAAALKEYQLALEQDPRLSEAIDRIARIKRDEGNPEEAIELVSKALQSDPRNFLLLRTLGALYSMRREYQRAVETDARIVAMDPSDEVDTANLCVDLMNVGDLAGAWRALDSISSHLPAGRQKSSPITDLELFLLICNRDFPAAKKYAESLPPENWRADWSKQQTLGDLHLFLGEKESARACFQEARVLLMAAVAKNPEEPQSHADLGLVDAGLGLSEEALREAQRAVDLQPIEKNPWMGGQWLVYLAGVNARLGRTEVAVKIIERLLAIPSAGAAMSLWQLKLDPDWDPLRNDPRFQQLIAPLSPKA